MHSCRNRCAILAAVALGALVLGLPSHSQAQAVNLKQQKAEINRILRGGNLAGADAQLFAQYFRQFFGQFLDPKAGPETFHDLRKELEIFLRTGKSGDAYNRLVAMANAGLQSVAKSPKFDPAVRLNSVLVLGSLKDKEPDGIPYPQAYPFLANIVTASPEEYPDALKVAAMIGLERYAAANILPARYKDPLTASMLAILEQETPPDSRTAEGHTWMRASAAKVLGALGSPGANNRVLLAMQKVVADSGARPAFRCKVAESLGRIKYPKDAQIDYQTLASLLGHQAVEICQSELDAAQASGRPVSRGMIVQGLASTLHGLEGPTGRGGIVAAASGAPGQEFISELRKKVKDAYDLTQDEDELENAELVRQVPTLVSELQSLLPPKPAPPKEDAVATADGAKPAGDAAAAAATGQPPAN